MGSALSKARLVLHALSQLSETYDLLNERLHASPGLPIPNPTLPFWTVPATVLPTQPSELPAYADIVIIGSGITGTSVAYNLLKRETGLKIVVLEAREVCSGATGRNGGHVNPPLYHDYEELKDKHGERVARIMVAFRRAHLPEVQRIATEEGILERSQCRETEHLDVFTCPKAFAEAKENLAKWRAAMPTESSSFRSYEREEAIKKFHLSDEVLGCIVNSGGAMHPYRFVTSLLAKLLTRHPDSLQVHERTPCTAVTSGADQNGLYTVTTPRGAIRTPHVVHATNAWASHLLPALRMKISAARSSMSAQRPGRALSASTRDGGRSFVFYTGQTGYDYLTQLLPSSSTDEDGDGDGGRELMFGGGWARACDDGLPEIGVSDDGVVNHASQSYLAGALPQYFGLENWGPEAESGAGGKPEPGPGGVRWGVGRTKAQWCGILGISADMLPWVGRVPEKIAGRPAPRGEVRPAPNKGTSDEKEEGEVKAHLAAPGEWVSAGYTGEGMVHAWLSGKALAHMLLDKDDEIRDWFPDILRVSEKRYKEANIENLIKRFM